MKSETWINGGDEKIYPEIILFPEISSEEHPWHLKKSTNGFAIPRYDIIREDGIDVGFIQCDGRLWTRKEGSAIQIVDSRRVFNSANRDSLLEAVRLAFLLTQGKLIIP